MIKLAEFNNLKIEEDIDFLSANCEISLILGVGSFFQNNKNYKDIDLIIVSDDFLEKTYCERLLICNYNKLKLTYDLFLYTIGEYILLQKEYFYIQNVKQKSKLLFKKESYKWSE